MVQFSQGVTQQGVPTTYLPSTRAWIWKALMQFTYNQFMAHAVGAGIIWEQVKPEGKGSVFAFP